MGLVVLLLGGSASETLPPVASHYGYTDLEEIIWGVIVRFDLLKFNLPGDHHSRAAIVSPGSCRGSLLGLIGTQTFDILAPTLIFIKHNAIYPLLILLF